MHPIPMNATCHPARSSPLASEDDIVISYIKYTIQSSSSPAFPSSSAYQSPDSIDLSASPPSFPLITKNNNQTHPHPHRLPILKEILETFLHADYSHLPDLKKWVDWAKTNKYLNSRVIMSNKKLHLLALTQTNGIDVYELPFSQGGMRTPILRKSFTSTHLNLLERMLQCRNVSGGIGYCGYCPSCLAFHTDRKVFVNKKGNIDKLEMELEELQDLIQKGDGLINKLQLNVIKYEKRGFTVMAKHLRKKIDRLQGWIDDPQKHYRLKKIESDRITANRNRELNEHSKLIQKPHWFISISCPSSLHIIFDAKNDWMTGRILNHCRRASDAFRQLLLSLQSIEYSKHNFLSIMRTLFRKLVVEAIQAQHPEIELTMEHQLHPFNKWDDAPDVHLLICQVAQDKKSKKYVEVSFDVQAILRELEGRMKTFAEFAVWAGKHWNNGCRSTEFKQWRKKVKQAAATVQSMGIPAKTVDIKLVPASELLGVHCYLRRQPMENVETLFLDRKTGIVNVRYYKKKQPAQFGIIDLLWRFVGFDGRNSGVQYTGAYRSGRDLKRSEKVDCVYSGVEASREATLDAVRKLRLAIAATDCQPVLTDDANNNHLELKIFRQPGV